MLFSLANKNSVVIGGAGGIGQAIVQGIAEAGAQVTIASRNPLALERAQREIMEQSGQTVAIYPVDATNEESVAEMVGELTQQLGQIHILVNAQGFNKKYAAEDFNMDDFRNMFEVNVISVMNTCKHFGRHMIGHGYGKIVNLTSVRGKIATHQAGNSGYCGTKGALDMITKQLAAEYGPHGITVNGLAPTLTETPMMTAIIEQRGGNEYRKKVADTLPLRRMAIPEDCVGPALFLCSDASNFVTGNIVYPDGGLTAIG